MSAKKRVTRGMEFLDAVRPGWHNQIFLERLDLLDNDNCIIGQLWRDPCSAMNGTELFVKQTGKGPIWGVRRGFVGGYGARTHREWAKIIRARREAEKQVFVPTEWSNTKEPHAQNAH